MFLLISINAFGQMDTVNFTSVDYRFAERETTSFGIVDISTHSRYVRHNGKVYVLAGRWKSLPAVPVDTLQIRLDAMEAELTALMPPILGNNTNLSVNARTEDFVSGNPLSFVLWCAAIPFLLGAIYSRSRKLLGYRSLYRSITK